MSTMMEKGRNLGTSVWLILLLVSVAIFGLNTGYATYLGGKLAGAGSSAADLQVLSQQLANQGREAVEGKADAFTAFKATKTRIDGDVAGLQSGYGSQQGVSSQIAEVAQTWEPLGKSAEQLIASEKAVLDLAGNANRFTSQVPNLQAQLDEVVRAMSAAGAASSQVYIALRQVVLASTMARRVTEIQAGGPTAALAGDALRRDAGVFESVLQGLREGGTANVQKVTNAGSIAALNQANALWVDMKKDLDAILGSSQNLFAAQSAAAAITAGSNELLHDSQ